MVDLAKGREAPPREKSGYWVSRENGRAGRGFGGGGPGPPTSSLPEQLCEKVAFDGNDPDRQLAVSRSNRWAIPRRTGCPSIR